MFRSFNRTVVILFMNVLLKQFFQKGDEALGILGVLWIGDHRD